jgi:chemotaxis protein methyltransferase CheR
VTRRAEEADSSVRPLGQREFDQIRELAYRTFGLDLKPGKEELVSARLQRLLRSGGFRSYQDYHRHVLGDSTGESLMALIDALATNHTSFLREADHFDFLRATVLPALANRGSMDIWSAACSTGEEIWTLACILRDVLPASRIRLVGTDISRKALAQAERAVYPPERLTGLSPAWIKGYFVPEGSPPKSYRVKPDIRSLAVFERKNLIEPITWSKQFPVIFCRNVMIYFDRATQQRVISNLARSLEPGGYLFVGHAESFTGIDHRLEYVRPAIYRQPGARKGGPWSGSS